MSPESIARAVRRGLAALALAVAVAGPAVGATGVSVARIVPAQPSGAAPDQIGVLVFFDFSPASQALISQLQQWGGGAGRQIVLDREPLATTADDPLVHAFVVARTLGVTDAVLPGLFKLAAAPPPAGGMQQALTGVFKPWGIEPVEFDAAWKSPLAAAGVTRSQALADRFAVTGAPTIIVNGLWRITAAPGTEPQALIDALNTQVAAVSTSEAENQ